MQPYQVLIASVLKPVDDIRMSRKIGLSIMRHTCARVHVAGFCTSYQAQLPPLQLHPIFCFSRLSFSRVLANAKLVKLGFWLRPRLLIITTHELLPAASVLSLVLKTKVVYDVQENYYRNIRFTSAFPAGIRLPLAALVRSIEYATRPVIDYYLLAERAYLKELDFVQHKAVVVENKYQPGAAVLQPRPVPVPPPEKEIRLLYSGTIAPTYGIFEAIALAEHLHRLDNRYRLHIIGYAPQPEVLAQVRLAIAGKSYITLRGGDKPVPHPEIVEAISQASFGLLAYKKNPGIDNCIPTKLYEYLANALPVISVENPAWEKLLDKWDAGFACRYVEQEIQTIHQKITSQTFYQKGLPSEVTWQSEELKLLKVLKKLGLYLDQPNLG